jgi:hypothetical protein
LSAVRSIPCANDDYTVKILGNVVELWCVSEEAGFSMLASDLEAVIDALLRAYIDTGQATVEGLVNA